MQNNDKNNGNYPKIQVNNVYNEERLARVFRQLYKSKLELGKGTIFTPPVLREKMIKIANPGIYDKILVMYNVEFMTEFQKYENVVFASDSLFKNELINKMFGNETILIPKNINNIKETFKDMKFDLIISNPPYNQNLDLKILKSIYDLSDKICFVHPAGWLLDNKNKSKLNAEIKRVCYHLASVHIFNTGEYFNAWTFVPNAIVLFDKCNYVNKTYVFDSILNEGYSIVDINDIDIHGHSDEYVSLKKSILEYIKNPKNILYHAKMSKGKYNVGHSSIAPGGRDVILPKKQICKDTAVNYHFSSQIEVENFKNYLKTKIVRFCLTIYKMNQNLVNRKNNFKNGAIASVPYMPDYTRPWSDEDIAKELGLTDEELAWAINWIPDYYPEDAEKYAKYKTAE